MAQENYSQFQGKWIVGQPVDMDGLGARRESKTLEGAGATAEPGTPVFRGAVDPVKGAKLIAAVTDLFLGVVRRTFSREHDLGTGAVKPFVEGDMITAQTEGVIPVIAHDTVTAGEKVYVQHTLNAGVDPGAYRNTVDTDNALLVNAIWHSSTSAADEMALINLNPPQS